MRIVLDPRRDGRIRLVLHELLHAHFDLDDKMVYEVEETAIKAWEDMLYAYLHHEKRAHALGLWDRAIMRKLG